MYLRCEYVLGVLHLKPSSLITFFDLGKPSKNYVSCEKSNVPYMYLADEISYWLIISFSSHSNVCLIWCRKSYKVTCTCKNIVLFHNKKFSPFQYIFFVSCHVWRNNLFVILVHRIFDCSSRYPVYFCIRVLCSAVRCCFDPGRLCCCRFCHQQQEFQTSVQLHFCTGFQNA